MQGARGGGKSTEDAASKKARKKEKKERKRAKKEQKRAKKLQVGDMPVYWVML